MMTCTKRDGCNDPMQAWCAMAWLAMSMFHVTASVAAWADDPSRLRLPAGSTRSTLGVNLHVYGLPLRVETFQSPVDVQATADAIVRQLDTPPSLLVRADALVLTWQSGSQHWVVRLTQPATRTHGTVSVLTLPDGDVPRVTAHTTPAWLPVQTQLRFTLDDTEGKMLRRHSVYTHGWPPSQLWPLLQERLRLAGWQRESGGVAQGTVHYTLGSRSLTLMVVAVADGSGVLVFEATR